MLKAVMSAAKEFKFDSTLMEASVKVLEKTKEERGASFDEVCLDQLKDAFKTSIAALDAQLAEGAPAKAVRATAVEEATTAKVAAEKEQEDLIAAFSTTKGEKDAAVEAVKAASKHLNDFMPDIQKAGDAIDDVKASLKTFVDGPLAAFTQLKDLAEDTFKAEVPYYETIDGKQCDRAIIDACRDAVAGQGDGRVSLEDAHKIFEKVADGGKETAVERWTMRYCMTHFKWTEAAHDWIKEACKKVRQEGKPEDSPSKKAKTGTSYYETIDGMKCDRGIVDACRKAVEGQGDGRVSQEDAEKVWAEAADGNKVTNAEKWTLRYCLTSFNFTRAGHDCILEKFQAL